MMDRSAWVAPAARKIAAVQMTLGVYKTAAACKTVATCKMAVGSGPF
jgi:hypothetical protein